MGRRQTGMRRRDSKLRAMTFNHAAPATLERPEVLEEVRLDMPWTVRVWNDPVNLMDYVTYVFMSHFGYPKAKAEQLMWQVHSEGSAAVASGTREQMEVHIQAMHKAGLWATLGQEA